MSLKIRQGEVYLVDFAKKYNSEFGKIRPAVILQNDFLNMAIADEIYKQVLVVPISSTGKYDDFKIVLEPRDKLKKRSFIVAKWVCTLDISRVLVDKGLITKLTEDELKELKQKVCNLI